MQILQQAIVRWKHNSGLSLCMEVQGRVMDTQLIEIIGKNRLINELLHAGLEVATPMRDRGIDLMAYVDINEDNTSFMARPIQMKAASNQSFSVFKKYSKVRGLLMAYVWHLNDPAKAVTYALTYPECVQVAEEMKWTETAAWKYGGGYSATNPSRKLCRLLEQYRMTPQAWKDKMKNLPQVITPV